VVTTNHNPFTDEWAHVYRAVARDVPIVALSRHHARSARPIPVAAVILHGLDLDTIPVGAGTGGYAVFLGRMSPDKGVREAVLTVRRAGVPLLIAAKMRHREEIAYFHEVVEPLLGDGVEFLGEVGGKEKYDLLGEALVLLSPAQWAEPFGLVMVEALATGTPVVCTSAGSAPELVTEGVTGFLRDDIEGLAAAVRRVDSLDRAACRRDVEERFGTARMVTDHLRFYERVLAR
jgi:glycosyltransferase involved in cell wall biosynthesis